MGEALEGAVPAGAVIEGRVRGPEIPGRAYASDRKRENWPTRTFIAIATGYFAVCRITGHAIGAQLEAAASLGIAQVAG